VKKLSGFCRAMLRQGKSSVRPSVCPSDCNVGGLWSHRLESSKIFPP